MSVWYDTAHLSYNGIKFCVLWYDVAYISYYYDGTKCCIFMVWYGIP